MNVANVLEQTQCPGYQGSGYPRDRRSWSFIRGRFSKRGAADGAFSRPGGRETALWCKIEMENGNQECWIGSIISTGPTHTKLLTLLEFIEDVIAGAGRRHACDVLAEAVFRKLLRERERTVCDALLDALPLQACTAQVRLSRRSLQRRAIAHALEFKIALNPIGAKWADAPV